MAPELNPTTVGKLGIWLATFISKDASRDDAEHLIDFLKGSGWTMSDTTKRCVVQITSCGVKNHIGTQCDYFVHALCDDGTVWRSNNDHEGWVKLPKVPENDN